MASVFRKKVKRPIPANAEIEQLPDKRIARWVDGKGRRQSAEVISDPLHGDRILRVMPHWYIAYQSARGRKHKKGYTDKEASVALGQRLEREAARRREGLTSEFDDHAKVPIEKHLDDYMTAKPKGSLSPLYVQQFRTRIDRVIKGTGCRRLHELDPVKVDRFFNREKIAGLNRNEYVGCIKAFTRWAVEIGRLEKDPLRVLKKTPRDKIVPKHPRRALGPQELARLFDAAERRPLIEVQTVRTGPRKGERTAKVSERVRNKQNRIGRERRLVYMLAVWTGLRRSEIKTLQWTDIDLDAKVPCIRLRAATTKSRRADMLVLHPQIVVELRQAKEVCKSSQKTVVSKMPGMNTLRADLKLAGIDPGDNQVGFVDFHSLRMTLSTMMATAGMSQRSRQSHMRHTDPRLTETTYMDERLLPVAQELANVPAIPNIDAVETAQDDVPCNTYATRATDVHRKSATLTLELTPRDAERQEPEMEIMVKGPMTQVLLLQAIGQLLASNDKASHQKIRGLLESG